MIQDEEELHQEAEPKTLEEALLSKGQSSLRQCANSIMVPLELNLSLHLSILGMSVAIFRITFRSMKLLGYIPGLFCTALTK